MKFNLYNKLTKIYIQIQNKMKLPASITLSQAFILLLYTYLTDKEQNILVSNYQAVLFTLQPETLSSNKMGNC